MGEVADLGSGALDDAPVVLDQRIGLVGQWLDLGGEASVEPLRRALAHHGERIAHAAQGLQAEQDGDGVDGDHTEAEQRQISEQATLEARDLLLQLAVVAHDTEPRGPVLGVEHELALEDL